jgi:hypothetical protein
MTFGTYEYTKNLTSEAKKTNIEGYFIEPTNRKTVLFSCTGSVNDVAIPSSFKVFANILKKFPEIGIQRPDKK